MLSGRFRIGQSLHSRMPDSSRLLHNLRPLYLLNDFNEEGNCVYKRHRRELESDMASIGAERVDFFSIDPSTWP